MQIKNPEIMTLIETIGQHYINNISNRFTRRALSTMSLDATTWSQIEDLTEKFEQYRYQGWHLDELYLQILALGRFIYQARKQIGPNLRYLAAAGTERASPADKVYAEMAINNFSANLKVLADQLNNLYMRVIEIDRELSGAKPAVYTKLPELRELGRYFVE
jgi:hypothetical protein